MSKPSLVDPKYFEKVVEKTPTILPKKVNLNVILLIIFVLFTAFFLYNCKYGYFKTENYVEPYSLSQF